MDELKARIGDLLVRADKVIELADHLTPRVDEIERTARRARWALWAMALLLSVQAVFGVFLFQTMRDQDRTTQDALCPVFSLLIGGYRPETRAEGPDRDAYNQSFLLFRDAYVALACRNGIVPPPIQN